MTTGTPQHPTEPDARHRQAHVQHELRAPLAVLYPLLSLLLDEGGGTLDARQRGYLEAIQRNVERLEGMVASVADSGYLDCAAAPAAPAAVALDDLAREVVAAKAAAGDESPRITLDAGARPLPQAFVDPDDAREIVADLLDNAVRFTPSSGSVAVRLAPGELPATVCLAVADDGCGVPDAELPHVFEFGFRGQTARERGLPGLGLGLWVCRELAARNGGRVELACNDGAGVTATLVLPAADGSAETGAPAPRVPA